MFKISIYEDSQKDNNILRNKSVSLSIADNNNPYFYAQIQGKVISREIDIESKFSNYLTEKYSNGNKQSYTKVNNSNLLIIIIKPEKITGWDPINAENFYRWMNE